jgi:Rrf2 family protein
VKLSKRTEYGLRAVVALARQDPNAFIQSRDLARQENLPNKFLEAILLALRRGDFLESKVGSGGGYRLSRKARDIRVGDLIRRLEGRPLPKEPPAASEMSPGELAVYLLNQRLSGATDQVLDALTLEQLLDQLAHARGAQQSMYYI